MNLLLASWWVIGSRRRKIVIFLEGGAGAVANQNYNNEQEGEPTGFHDLNNLQYIINSRVYSKHRFMSAEDPPTYQQAYPSTIIYSPPHTTLTTYLIQQILQIQILTKLLHFEMASNSQPSIDSSQSMLWPTSIEQPDTKNDRYQNLQQTKEDEKFEAGKSTSDNPPKAQAEFVEQQNTEIQVKAEEVESMLIEPNTLNDNSIGQMGKEKNSSKQQNDSTLVEVEAKPANENKYTDIQERDPGDQKSEDKSEGIKQNTLTNIPLKPNQHPKYTVQILQPVHQHNQLYSNLPDALYRPYVEVLDQLDHLKEQLLQHILESQKQAIYRQMADIIWAHIEPKMHPEARSELGGLLVRNGKFVVELIEASHRKYEKDKEFLKLYLYEHFKKQGNIQNDILTFNQQYLKIKAAEISILYPNLDREPSNDDHYLNDSVIAVKDKNESTVEISDLIYSEQPESENKVQKQQKEKKPQNRKKLKRDKDVQQEHGKGRIHVEQSKGSNRRSTKRKTKKSRELESLKKKRKNREAQSEIGTESVQTEDSNKKLGSYYSYKLQVDKKDHLKNLRQVRTSARLSKKKNERPSQAKHKQASKSKGKKSRVKQQQIQISESQYQPQQSVANVHANSDDQSVEQIVEVDWIKKHLPEINVQEALMYRDFKAMTKEDKKITEFLLSLEEEDEGEEKQEKMKIDDEVSQNIKKIMNQIHSFSGSPSHDHTQPDKESHKKYNSFRIEELPLTIEEVIDPNINNHNIYALLKLSRLSSLEMGTRYALTRLTKADMANHRHILQDLQKAKGIVGEAYGENLGYIQLNEQILKMIDEKKKQSALK